ncbi:MAG TPA: serine hydrolase [Bacteroidales bacterium]|nr:serine hydrolase [Bacteroidales bacterium]HRZ20185.1 serine hydrolase [Bacteroidales bacterium]
MKKLLIFISISLLMTACLKDDPIKLPNGGYVPVQRDDGWIVSTPEAELMDVSLLNEAYELFYSDEEYPMINSLLVIRHGKLLAEAYCKSEADIDRLNNIQSCTKSITSLLTGIAIDQGLITDLNSTLYSYYPEAFDEDPGKRKITLRNCLVMEAGIDFNNDENTEELYFAGGSSLGYILSLPMSIDTGTLFHYNDGLPHLVAGAITAASQVSLARFAADNLFGPIGIEDYFWENSQDGLNFGAFSLFLKPRDLARLGQLCLQQGSWNGQQIVSDSWLQQAATVHAGGRTPYGYYFWIYPDMKGYGMIGHGGQFVFICNEKDLVIVCTASGYTNEILWGSSDQLIELIYRACR